MSNRQTIGDTMQLKIFKSHMMIDTVHVKP